MASVKTAISGSSAGLNRVDWIYKGSYKGIYKGSSKGIYKGSFKGIYNKGSFKGIYKGSFKGVYKEPGLIRLIWKPK